VLKYDWEHPDFDPSEDKFMQRFDENGNFVNIPKLEENAELEEFVSYYSSNVAVDYEISFNGIKTEVLIPFYLLFFLISVEYVRGLVSVLQLRIKAPQATRYIQRTNSSKH
jgi:hypothetical protein